MIIGLDAGHTLSGADTGAQGVFKEEVETRAVVSEMAAMLRSQGHTVVPLHIDYASSLNQSLSVRYDKANAAKCDLVVSVHFNAYNKAAYGAEVFTYNAEQHAYAKRALDALVKVGFTNRGIKDGSGLAIIRETNMTAMLVEVCFCDNAQDAAKYAKIGAKKIALELAKAIDPNIAGKKEEKKEENKMRDEDHWAYPELCELNTFFAEKGVEGIKETRLDDNITRGELFRVANLLRKALKK